MWTSAYRSGHHATVEGGYTDVLHVDAGTYWAESVDEFLAERDEPATRAATVPQGVLDDGIVVRIQAALGELRAPSHITELRQEYWKAGARAAIAAINSATTPPPAELGKGRGRG